MKPWPILTNAQVSALEERFPPRCLSPNETVEDHLRYAGKVDLIATLRSAVVDTSASSLDFTDDEEEAIDLEALEIASQQQGDEP